MKKVKFIYNDPDGTVGLTLNKVYDVIKYNKNDNIYMNSINIYNDNGKYSTCYICSPHTIYFIDVTSEYRNEIIDDILE